MRKKNLSLFAFILCAVSSVSFGQESALPYREVLRTQLLSPTVMQAAAGEQAPLWEESPCLFCPESDYSVDLNQFSPASGGELRVATANGSGKGFRMTLPVEAVANDYRFVQKDNSVYIYKDKQLYATESVAEVASVSYPLIREDADTPPVAGEPLSGKGIYDSRNLIRNPGFETEEVVLSQSDAAYKFFPSDWSIHGANAMAQQAMGVRCNKGDANYANGREGSSALMFRQDGSGGFSASAGSYISQQLSAPLKPGRKYRLSFQVLSHTNDLGKTFAIGVGSKEGTWDLLYRTWVAPAEKQTLQTYEYEFQVPARELENAYVAFICYGATGIVHLDRVSLVEAEGDYNTLSVSFVPEQSAELSLGNVTYEPYAFTPVRRISNGLVDGGEYFLRHVAYERFLGEKDDALKPGLSAAWKKDSLTYVFVAEVATDGWCYLRQKSSGRYLSAVSGSTYSMEYADASANPQNRAQWQLVEGRNGTLKNRSNGKLLGCDAGKEADDYISVFYDKAMGEYSIWQLLDARFPWEESWIDLYKRPFSLLQEEASAIENDEHYSAASKETLRAEREAAEEIYEAASSDPAALEKAIERLQAAIEACKQANSEICYAGADFMVKDAYTVAINRMQLKDENSEVTFRICDRKGRETLFSCENNSLYLNGEPVADGVALHETPADLRLAFCPASVTLYKDMEPLAVLPLTVLPENPGNAKPEFVVMGKANLKSYMPELVSVEESVAPGAEKPNAHGKAERRAAYLYGTSLVLDTPVDLHFLRESRPLETATIDLCHEDAWVIFDNTLPSEVVASYLSKITVNGEAAKLNQNIRLSVYLNGAVLIPHAADYKPFEGYSEALYGGDATAYAVGKHALGKASNTFRGFILKRGYMACLSTDANGGGYSRVYVADHEDLCVPQLPEALDRRISGLQIKKWNYVSKKGWCSTTGSSAVATECKKMRATWYYTWSADRNNTYDTEYVPIKQHIYWPSWGQINALGNCTHVLGFNEPEHAEQHTSNQCSCGGVIDAWKSCTYTPSFQESGMRIGSPAPTDMDWLYQYVGHCNDMAYRLDFVAIHAYWGTNEMPDPKAWYNQLKAIYDKTKRPIWITEWNNGASWTTESWPSGYGEKLEKQRAAIEGILTVLDTCRFVERYSIYNWDTYYRAMINYDDGWVTPAGEVYRDRKPTFAYNAAVQYVPHWWAPGAKDVALTYAMNTAKKEITFVASNPNKDMTETLVLQRKRDDGTYEDLYVETERSRYDEEKITIVLPFKEAGSGKTDFRLKVSTLRGAERLSDEVSCELPVQFPDGLIEIGTDATLKDGEIHFNGVGNTTCQVYDPSGRLLEILPVGEGSVSVATLPKGQYILVVGEKGVLHFIKE